MPGTTSRPFSQLSAHTAELPVEALRPGAFQPRRHFCQTALEELAASIKQVGLLEPICVRPDGGATYEIIAGNRRWQASRLAGLVQVPCRVFDVTEEEAFVLAIAENLQRRDLSPLEEAEAYQAMLDRGLVRNRAGIARLLAVSRARITQRMRLLELDNATQERVRKHPEILTEYHARLLWGIKDLVLRHQLADAALENRWSGLQLKVAIEEYQRAKELTLWELQEKGCPRVYRISHPGFSLTINFLRADLQRSLETATRLVERLKSIVGGKETVDSTSQPDSRGSVKTF